MERLIIRFIIRVVLLIDIGTDLLVNEIDEGLEAVVNHREDRLDDVLDVVGHVQGSNSNESDQVVERNVVAQDSVEDEEETVDNPEGKPLVVVLLVIAVLMDHEEKSRVEGEHISENVSGDDEVEDQEEEGDGSDLKILERNLNGLFNLLNPF